MLMTSVLDMTCLKCCETVKLGGVTYDWVPRSGAEERDLRGMQAVI